MPKKEIAICMICITVSMIIILIDAYFIRMMPEFDVVFGLQILDALMLSISMLITGWGLVYLMVACIRDYLEPNMKELVMKMGYCLMLSVSLYFFVNILFRK